MIQHFDPRRSYGLHASADRFIDELIAKLNEVIDAVNELRAGTLPDLTLDHRIPRPTHNED